MVIFRYKICDFCGSDHFKAGSLKIKRKWISWYESGWTRLDICSECAEKLQQQLERRLDKR